MYSSMVHPLLPLAAFIVWAMGLLALPAPSFCAMATIRALLLPHHSFHKSEQSGAFLLETETRGGKKKPQLVIQESPLLLLLLLSSPHAGQPNSLPNFLGRAYHFPPPNF